MYKDLAGKVAFITGAGREKGIGQATARRFASEGAHVVVSDICRPLEGHPEYGLGSWEYLESLANDINRGGGRALAVKVDVREGAEVEAMFEAAYTEFARIDILFNNAGAAPGSDLIVNLSEEDWKLTVDICLTGAFLCSKAVIPYLVEGKGGGRIINTSSVAGKDGVPGLGAYSSGKAGMILLTQTLARELGPEGITVNAICPGVIDTLLYHEEEVTLWMKLYDLTREAALRVLEDEPALARLGSPDEVANLVVFLASDQASYITGQAINVCGGLAFH